MPVPRPRRVARRIERWFASHQRPLPWRDVYDPYRVWVSEVMLQQTRMEVVLGYYDEFLRRFPTVDVLARASEQEVMAAWSGLGYYRRARMLRAGAIDVVQRFGGNVPTTAQELLTISGIGRYTAGAIASIAHRRKAPIVDGNVARIVARLEGIEAPLGSPALMREAWQHAETLVAACSDPRAFNQGLMEVGALLCTPRSPSCLLCPVADDCVARATGRAEELPRPNAKKATRELRIPLYVVIDDFGRILMRRESGALMTDMYHLPHGDDSLLPGATLDVTRGARLGVVRHTVTTRRIQFEVFRGAPASLPAGPPASQPAGYEWIDPAKLGEIPHPSYVRKALALM